jgi:poly(hydroxyalkanoate) depolymerase family esterase
MPEGARYETRSFSCAAGSRDYLLYVPAALPEGPQGLVLMLHGCTQDADDFARGTDINRMAERYGFIVAYPEQTRAHNPQACWNWFRPGDQGPGRGEPEILASLARDLVAEFGIARGRVFAAGLSAGGGMAAILGITHPEVFSAIGVHSGLPHGAAHDVISAFAAMRGDAASGPARSRPVRTIVFHGSADPTVHPSNADRIIEAAAAGSRVVVSHEIGRSRGGRTWSRTIASTPDGTALTEDWRIEGAGHAWSGGVAEGSYTDPTGPDASEEMARFFMAGSGADA